MATHQSKIDRLIEELCPQGVEFKTLGEIGTLVRGSGLQKKDFVEDGVGCIHYGQIYTYYGIFADRTKTFVSEEMAKRLKKAQKGDVLIAGVSENIEDVCKSLGWLGGEICISGDMFAFRHNQNTKFITYLLQTVDFQKYKEKHAQGAKVTRVKSDKILAYTIPIPPLAVQEAIVKILDTFTELESELEAELEARKKQYEYYRNELIFSSKGLEKVPLGGIATIGTGSHDTKDAVVNGEYMFYARGRETLCLDSFDFDENAIITAGDGVGVGKVFHFASGKYALHQRAYRIVPNQNVDSRFIYHYLVADFARYLEQTSVHASVTSLRRPMFLKYPVSLPPLPEQKRIVSILDKFDALVNNISIGLPAEIQARRQQYEYYRGKLFTFKELKK